MVFLVLPDCEEPDRLLAALQAAEIMGALEVIETLLYNNRGQVAATRGPQEGPRGHPT